MTTKRLIWRLIIPLTIISFGALTKWWYVLPVDAPDTIIVGFPLAFVSDGWFTSMSLQFFLIEFIVDFAIYFLFCFLIVLLAKRILVEINVSRIFKRIIWALAILTISFWVMVFTITENHIKLKRDWDMQVMVTGYKLTWTHKDKPEFLNYDSNKK